MKKPCVIVIELTTRERMKRIARKHQTWDQFINEALDVVEEYKK